MNVMCVCRVRESHKHPQRLLTFSARGGGELLHKLCDGEVIMPACMYWKVLLKSSDRGRFQMTKSN